MGRKKRSAAEDANPMTDVVERVNEIYNSVITSEQCMERIACELGGLASDVGLKESPMAKMADLFVTAKYKPYYKQFKSGNEYFIDKLYSQEEQQNLLNLLLRTFNFNLF